VNSVCFINQMYPLNLINGNPTHFDKSMLVFPSPRCRSSCIHHGSLVVNCQRFKITPHHISITFATTTSIWNVPGRPTAQGSSRAEYCAG
jgi:hypothetical protein